jgi:anti-sigma factor RsiW
MSAENVTETEIQAFADGRLPPERAAEVAQWLAEHGEEAERVDAYRRMGEELRGLYDPVMSEPLPIRLQRAAHDTRAAWRVVGFAAGWLVIGGTLGLLAGWQLHAWRAPTQTALMDTNALMARRAAVAHAVYSPEVRHPVEVGADQEQHLVAWLSKRLGVKVKAPRLDDIGMSLVGGRLLPGDVGPVAQFMYQNDKGRRLTMYVRAENGAHRETAFRYARENNVGVFYWVDRDCGYAIASGDLNRDELLRVATTVYKQFEP